MSISTLFTTEPVAGRYRLIRQVGSGNMSTVYEAHDLRRGQRIVAVKLLNTAHEDVLKQEIFRRETRALSQLEHSNIVSVLDYGWSDHYHCHYLVFEYIPRTLLDEIAAHPITHDNEWCWSLMRQMADALVHAHSQGIIHRDVKPSNILIDTQTNPKVVDFGISLLRFELATGVTVSSFFSIGYASPEQRRGEQATEQSDIYSLGCVFYHMLARQAPPSEGYLASTHIDALSVYERIKQILHRMLAPNLSERFPQMVQVRRSLEVTHTFEMLSEVYLLVTDRARRDLFDQGYIDETSTKAACTYILQELGDDSPKTIHMSLAHSGDIRLSTSTLRLICARDPVLPVLAIKAVHVPYLPQMEQEKSHAVPVRFLWQVIGSLDTTTLPPSLYATMRTTLDSLSTQLGTKQITDQAKRQRRSERKDFTNIWAGVLSFHQDRLDAVTKLPYHYVTRAGDTLIFQLKDPAPDNLSWPSNAPVVAIDPEKPQREFPVGHVISINGKILQVSRDTGDIHSTLQPIEHLPSPGLIGLYQQEAKVALDRQQKALSIIRDGGTVNPRLPEVLIDLSVAEFDTPDMSIEFFERNLAEDKQRAVRQALAARDIFLLQGPPGTGKTTTLAEIILQILKVKPDARILVASQSNVAVNHILSRLAEQQGNQPIEIVRIGRAEKIGHGAQVWTIEQRMADWRSKVIERTNPKITGLKASLRQMHREARKQQSYSVKILEDLQLCQTWLEELSEPVVNLATLEGKEWQKHFEEVVETLALIRDTLPEEKQGNPLSTVTDEWERLSKVVANLLSPGVSDSREQSLLALVESWRKIFGTQDDFAIPILERATVLAATCLKSGGEYLKDQQFDWAIIDEAGRATAPELLVSLVRSRRAIIVGDERQLPPMIEDLSDEELTRLGTTKEYLTESLFESLVTQGKDEQLDAVHMLTMQHRMHPAIGQLVSTVFYGGKLTHAVDAKAREHGLPWLKRSVAWFSTTKLPKHYETPQGLSFYNRAEVQSISRLLHQMERSYREQEGHREVAVITPYNAQIVELQAEIIPDSVFWQALSIEISTIDAFQGRDRDIVLYSPVRSNKIGKMGFLRDRRRLNVALSRARQALLIVGDIQTLEHGYAGKFENPYQELVRYLRTHPEDCLIETLDQEVSHG